MTLAVHDLSLFAAAALLVNLTPGPDMLFVIGQSAAHGRRAGMLAALGIGAGCLLHIGIAAAGLSALLAASPAAFAAVSWVGAAYLVWIGLSMLREALSAQGLRAPADSANLAGHEAAATAQAPRMSRVFWQGALTNALNPKVALFFAAFLPQFIDAGARNPGWSFVLLGLLFNVGGTVVNVVVAAFVSGLRGRLRVQGGPSWRVRGLQTAAGAVFIGLGVKLAFGTR